ncbi:MULTISPECIES: oxidoreductase [unclassified Streptomyces]|uniref:oxidoreductase n=1 Tax=unclassified Streptomyces TaxID=2593676 RepID=UPI002E2C61E9|nr:oxidoreductase [Streptomyces sp. NBC_01439]
MPLRPLGLGDIVSASFATLGRHWKQLLGVMLAVQGICLLAMALLAGIAVAAVYDHIEPVLDPPYGRPPSAEHLTPFLVAAVTLFVLLLAVGLLGMAMLTALCPAVLREAVRGRPTTFRAMWDTALRRTPAVLGALALTGLIAGAPVLAALAVWIPVMIASTSGGDPSPGAMLLLPVLMLLALPVAVWLGTRLSLAPAAAVMEEAGPVIALRRSAALVKGQWWRIFGISLVGSMIGMSVAYLIQMPFQLIGMFGMLPLMVEGGEGATPSAGTIVGLVFCFACLLVGGGVSQMFQTGYTQLVNDLLYVDQRIRREDLASAILAEAAAQTPGTVPTAAPAPAPGPAPADTHPAHPDPRPNGQADT